MASPTSQQTDTIGQGQEPYDEVCYQIIPNGQHFLFAYLPDFDGSIFLIMSGAKTSTVGSTVEYMSALLGIWL